MKSSRLKTEREGEAEAEAERPYVVCSKGFRSFQKYRRTKNWGDDDVDVNPSRRLMCFATKLRPWARADDEDDDDHDEEDEVEGETKRILVRVYVVCPDDCCLYRVARYKSSTADIACASADSKVFIFEAGQVSYSYMDLRRMKRKRRKEWVRANEHLNRKKRHPVSFTVGGKIFILDTGFISESGDYEPEPGEEEDHAYRFEVLDPRHPQPCWTPLSSPPYPFGMSSVWGSWTQEATSDSGARIFVDAVCDAFRCIFVYNVDKDSWNLFKPSYKRLPFPFAFHLVGSDFAPLPDTISLGNLFALVDLNFCPPPSAVSGSRLPTSLISPAKVLTDKKDQLFIKSPLSQEEWFNFTGWHSESLWTLHCLPLDSLTFWQVIHLGGSRFCILTFYIDSGCCLHHSQLHVRVATFDITDQTTPVDASIGGTRILDAKYVLNKVYTLGNFAADPLPCTQLLVA